MTMKSKRAFFILACAVLLIAPAPAPAPARGDKKSLSRYPLSGLYKIQVAYTGLPVQVQDLADVPACRKATDRVYTDIGLFEVPPAYIHGEQPALLDTDPTVVPS